MILRDLLVGPRRYSDLLEGLPGITTNLLAKRLRALTADGLIAKGDGGYVLTPLGRPVEPIVLALADFGSQTMTLPPDGTDLVSSRAMVLNLKRRYLGHWSGGMRLCFEAGQYRVTTAVDGLVIDDLPGEVEVTLSQQGAGFARWIIAGEPLQDLIAQDAITVDGHIDSALSFDAFLRAP